MGTKKPLTKTTLRQALTGESQMQRSLTTLNVSHKTLTTLFLMIFLLPILSGCKQEQQAPAPVKDDRPVMRIAFVGNEYTANNNMIYMLQLMAQNDPSSHFQLQVDSVVAPDASLATLWRMEKKNIVLKPESWDYVILQPHSMWASTEGAVYISQKTIATWAHFVRNIQAQPVLLTIWPLASRNPNYGNIKYTSTLKSPINMFRLIRGYSKATSKKLDLLQVPVGDYWMQSMNVAPALNLYDSTESFPSLEGSYLTALIIYKTLVDNTLSDITYIPQGMDEATKDLLISIASTKIAN
jgi:hypothetical protein